MLVAVSCDQHGISSICPVLPLYQTFPVGDASVPDTASSNSTSTQAAEAAAIDSGCLTAPADGAPDNTSASSAGEGGASSADNAGAGGHD